MPLLVMTLTTPPVAPPNSALKPLVLTTHFFDHLEGYVVVDVQNASSEVADFQAVDNPGVLRTARAINLVSAASSAHTGSRGKASEGCSSCALRQHVDDVGRDVRLDRAAAGSILSHAVRAAQ